MLSAYNNILNETHYNNDENALMVSMGYGSERNEIR